MEIENFTDELGVMLISNMAQAVGIAEHMPEGRRVLGEALCAAMETVATGGPVPALFNDWREDAEWWADVASPLELEAYAGAALRRIERATFAPSARKRLFLMFWETLSDADKLAFLGKVDPGGRFIGGQSAA